MSDPGMTYEEELLGRPDVAWTKSGLAGARLAFLIPVTPWPVFFWIQHQGPYGVGKHSAEPLYPVALHAYLATISVHALGIVLLYCFVADWRLRVPWLIGVALHGLLMWEFLERNAVAYC